MTISAIPFYLMSFSLSIFLRQTGSESSSGYAGNATIDADNVCGTGLRKIPEVHTEQKQLKLSIVILILAMSWVCNILIIHVIRVNSHMQTNTNYLIANMSTCDLLGSLRIGGGVFTILNSGFVLQVPNYMYCKAMYYLMYSVAFCSIFSLVLITFDRFLAVTRPLKYQNHCSWTKYAIPVIWLMSLAIPLHYALEKIVLCKINDKTYCIPGKSPMDAIMFTIFCFAIPHVIMVVLYAIIAYKLCTRHVPGEHTQEENRQQIAARKVARKVTIMIICILISFEITWGPAFVDWIFPYLYTQERTYEETTFLTYSILCISNGVVNCLIYAIFNENFRKAFQATLKWKLIKTVVSGAFAKVKRSTENTTRNRPGDEQADGIADIPMKTLGFENQVNYTDE